MMDGKSRKNLRDYDIVADLTGDCKPLGPNEGRIGHIPFCKPGEELRKPLFEIGTYENGAFIPQTCG